LRAETPRAARQRALDQERDNEMDAPRNWLSALITTDCLLPRVVSEMFAVNPGALAVMNPHCASIPSNAA